MSHEIRTPITGILGMNEMIQRESDSEDVLRYSDNIQKAGVSLLGIISDILDFSKIEAGRMELASVEYDLAALLTDSLNLIRLRAEEKGLALYAEVDPALPARLRGDELRVKQILTNLLMNAVKYTEKGSIRLECRLDRADEVAAYLSVAVIDTGIGIRAEEMDRLFSAFDRLDMKRTRHIEGTGLGLPITARMLSLMGSELSVESDYGKGSKFYFLLRQEVAGRMKIGAFNPLAVPVAARERTQKASPFTAPDARILLVDDTPMNLQVITGLLKRTEMRIDTAEDGESCIGRFGAEDYDLVFLDYRMPNMDGIETLHKLKELYPEKAGRTPIICLTASAVSGDRERMLAAGFTDYLTKPVNIAAMEESLLRYLPAEKVKRNNITVGAEEPERLLPSGLYELPLLDPAEGIRFCGGEQGYLDALKIYCASIETKAADIEQNLADRDIDAYTIAVHSLKSTSRTVGAAAVSELAKALEQAGNDRDVAAIQRDTPRLLELYRSLKAPLEASLGIGGGEKSAARLPLLPDGDWAEALQSLRDMSAMFDYDSVNMVMDMLAQYTIPESHRAVCKRLRDAVERCDWDAINAALTEAGA